MMAKNDIANACLRSIRNTARSIRIFFRTLYAEAGFLAMMPVQTPQAYSDDE